MDWLISALSILTTWAIGERKPWGWAVKLAATVPWAILIWEKRLWGLVVPSIITGWLSWRNYRKWTEERIVLAAQPQATCPTCGGPLFEGHKIFSDGKTGYFCQECLEAWWPAYMNYGGELVQKPAAVKGSRCHAPGAPCYTCGAGFN